MPHCPAVCFVVMHSMLALHSIAYEIIPLRSRE
jgi:hypothetical protein